MLEVGRSRRLEPSRKVCTGSPMWLPKGRPHRVAPYFSARFLVLCVLLLLTLIGSLLTACSDGQSATPTSGADSSRTTTAVGSTTAPAVTTSPATPGPANSTTVASATVSPTVSARGDIPDISPFGEYKPFEQIWKTDLPENSNAGVVGEADGLTFVKTRLGALYALDTKSGATVWKIAAPTVTGLASPLSPLALVTPGLVILGDLTAEKVTAYDSKSGQKRWEQSLTFDAANRDKGSRFIGGKIYNRTLVVGVSSKQDPYTLKNQTLSPEYLLIDGINLDSGHEVWSAITDPAPANRPNRRGDIVFTSKLVVVESPDLSDGAIEPETGKRGWRVVDLFLLRNEDNPDALYSLVPESGKLHHPVIALSDLDTGKLNWQKILPIQSVADPLVVVSPDQKSAYASVVASEKESYLFMIDLTTNQAMWKLDTSAYGVYDLRAFNEGVRLRNYGTKAGIAFFAKTDPNPAVWFAGGIQVDDVVTSSEGLYLTARDSKSGLFYFVGTDKGEVRFSSRLEISASVPTLGKDQIYVTTLDTNGKPIIYAFKRAS